MKRTFKFSLVCFILVLALFGGIGVIAFANTGEPMTDVYEIYPAPQSITYTNQNTVITDKVNLIIGNDIDEATENHIYDTFSVIDSLTYKNSRTIGNTNVLVGVYNSGDEADMFLRTKGNVDYPAGIFNKIDAYVLTVKGDKIVIVGKDTDAAFYGVTTLKAVLSQIENRTVRNFTVCDYSDTQYRGFIEGYYGFPWSTEDRVELMRFGGQFKTNIYIYAPKDDPYHGTNWRGLYSPRDLAELKEQIDAGVESKTRFAWSIHPFLSQRMTADNYADSLADLIAKFNQLYDAGVRQFVISADDLSTEGMVGDDFIGLGNLQRDLLNDVCKWQEEKGDCYKLIFVPSAYCYHSFQNLGGIDGGKYFEGLMENLDENVDIMWTGDLICSRIDNLRLEEFGEYTNGRKPFVWMNWPVNDYNQDRLLLSKGEAFDYALPASGEAGFTGIVTNPLERAEASKLAIFATADYCWNIEAFDCDKSYDDSFKYIETTATAEFREIASHMANAGNYDGIYFEESPEFVDDTAKFLADYKAGKDVTETAKSLVKKFEKVINACDGFMLNASNQKLKVELEPWVKSLKLTCQAGKAYMDIVLDKVSTTSQLLDKVEAAEQILLEKSQLTVPRVNTERTSTPLVSMVVIEPFMSEITVLIGDELRLSAGVYTGIVSRGFPSVYEGALENIYDGNPETYAWLSEAPLKDYFVRIDLGELTMIKDITIISGNSEGRDIWNGAIVQCSADGKNYVTVGEIGGEKTLLLLENPAEYRYIKIMETDERHETWVSLKEVSLNTTNYTTRITYENLKISSKPNQNITGLLDTDKNTYTWFEKPEVGAWLKLDLLEVKSVNNVQLLMSNAEGLDDYPNGVTLSYSVDGTQWTTIDSYENQRNIYAIFDSPIQARYIKADFVHDKTNWFIARDFSVNNDYAVSFGDGYSLYKDYRITGDIKHLSSLDAATDGDVNTALDLAKNPEGERAIYLDLKESITVNNIYMLTGGVGWDDFITNCDISYSVDGDAYTQLGNYTSEDGVFEITLDQAITARYIKILVNDDTWVAVRELAINKA